MSLEVKNGSVIVEPPDHGRLYWFKRRQPYHAAVKRLSDAGKNGIQIAAELGISRKMTYSCLHDLGVDLVPSNQFGSSRRVQYHADVLRLYESGASVLAIAKELGVERTLIYGVMNDLGLHRRSGSEANSLRMARLSPNERLKLTEAAHAATRGFSRSQRTRIAIAKSHERTRKHIGAFETEVGKYLASQDIKAFSQRAWNGYNLDFFIETRGVAVEVYTTSYRPASISKTAKKTMKLLCAGISVIDLWINRRVGETASPAMLEQLIAFVKVARPLPSGLGQYRVVRGRGDLDPISQRYLDEFADVAVRYRSMQTGGEDTR